MGMRTAGVSLLFVILALIIANPALAQVAVSGDRFSKSVEFLGSAERVNPFGGTSRLWRLRSFLDRQTRQPAHQLYVDIGYVGSHWRFYEAASDEDANELKVTSIDRSFSSCGGVAGCIYSEVVGVDVPPSTLAAKATSGFQIKLVAKTGESLILTITSGQVSQQLKAIERFAEAPSSGSPAILAPPPAPFGVDFGTTPPRWGSPGGALAGWIKGGSVAAAAGLKWADTIVEWNGGKVSSADEARALIAKAKSGDRIPFKILRGRQLVDLVANF